MSIDLMRRIREENATTIAELKMLFGLAESSVYRYFESTPLKADQLFQMFKLAKSDRVRELILAELLPGSGAQVVWLPESMDADGDGDVDTDDAMNRAITAVGLLHDTLKQLRSADDDKPDHDKLLAIRESFVGLIEESTAGLSIVDFLIKELLARPRKRCRPTMSGSGGRH